jgi:hypothetical protein
VLAFALAACRGEELPSGAYGRVTEYRWACESVEEMQRLKAIYDADGYKGVGANLWNSGSCISFRRGDVIFFAGEGRAGFVKVGRTHSKINFYADPEILNVRR